jgi:RNA polymerase sigma factor (sigma-70 family)
VARDRAMDRSPTSASELQNPGPKGEGTATVIESLSARFRGPLRRFFEKRNIPRSDVEDLIQDVFLRLAAREGVESMERLEAYLFTTASNLLTDRHRRLTSRAAEAHVSYEESLHGGSLDTGSPERALLATQIVAKLVEALFEMPERTRIVFTLYHLEDLPHKEIAQRLGIAVSTIEKHMGRANAYLASRMEGL